MKFSELEAMRDTLEADLRVLYVELNRVREKIYDLEFELSNVFERIEERRRMVNE